MVSLDDLQFEIFPIAIYLAKLSRKVQKKICI